MTTRVIQNPISDPSQRSYILKIPKTKELSPKPPVKRQLFGAPNKEDTRRFIDEQLKCDNDIVSQKWDFDFMNGKPKLYSDAKYKWTKLITFAPRRPSKPEPEPDNTDLYAMPLPIYENDEETKKEDSNHTRKEKVNSKQSQITDFLSIRKRKLSESVTKKTTQSVIPTKISKHDNITS